MHRLVAQAFILNPDGKPYVNHKDANKLNNTLENLEWCTHMENVIHAVANDRLRPLRMEENPHSKLTVDLVRLIKTEYCETNTTQRKLAKKYGVGKTTIQNVLAGERWNDSV